MLIAIFFVVISGRISSKQIISQLSVTVNLGSWAFFLGAGAPAIQNSFSNGFFDVLINGLVL